MEPDGLILAASALRTAREWFDSPELQSCILRFAVSSVVDITEPGETSVQLRERTDKPIAAPSYSDLSDVQFLIGRSAAH